MSIDKPEVTITETHVFSLPVVQFKSLIDFANFVRMGHVDELDIFDVLEETGRGFVSRFATIVDAEYQPTYYVATLSYLRPRMIVIDESGRQSHGTDEEQMEYQEEKHAELITAICDELPETYMREGDLAIPHWVTPVYVKGYGEKMIRDKR